MKAHKLLSFCWTVALVAGVLVMTAAGQHVYTEDFTTTTYKDVLNTTALWDTVAGQLKLPPFQITLIGSYDTPGGPIDLMVAGDLAFLADAAAGLAIIDITNPASPSHLGSYDTPGSAQGLWIDGDRAFVCDDGTGLLIFDITNASVPSLIGSFNTSGRAFGVEVAGDYAYVADGTDGLKIIDISNPSTPSLVGSYNTPGFARSIDVEGKYAFVADRGGGGLQIIDISNPPVPMLVGYYDPGGDTWGVKVSGNVAYLGAASAGLVAVDVTDPSNPTLLGAVAAGSARQVDVAGDFVCVAGYGDVFVFDVSDPSLPILIDSYATPGIASDVAVEGDRVYVADGAAGGLQVLDCADPITPPAPLDEVWTAGYGYGIDVDGDTAFVAAGLWGLIVCAIDDPGSITLVGGYDTPGDAYGVMVNGDYAYVADGDYGLHIIDVSNPTSPVLLGTYDTPVEAIAVDVCGNRAVVADGVLGDMLVINVGNPSSPYLEGTYPSPSGMAFDVALHGDIAVLTGFGRVDLVDISNPATPIVLGAYSAGGVRRKIAVAGDVLYVTSTDSLHALDISDPTTPVLLGSLFLAGTLANGVAIAGDYAIVANGDLSVVDISNPSALSLMTTYDGSDLWDVVVSGDIAYAVDQYYGIQPLVVFQRQWSGDDNLATSLDVLTANDTKHWVRLDAVATDSVSWEVSADGGTNWEAHPAGNFWLDLNDPGSQLRWRAALFVSGSLSNPTVSSLDLEWSSDHAEIVQVSDVPDDQGGWLRVHFRASGLDMVSSLITMYTVWQRVDDIPLMSSEGTGIGAAWYPEIHAPPAMDGVHVLEREGRYFVRSTCDLTSRDPAAERGDGTLLRAPSFPPGTWEAITSIGAVQEEQYIVRVPTLADSSESGIPYSVYVITAHQSAPTWYIGLPDSGYSVDNIAPGAPTGFSVAYNTGSGNQLAWDPSPDEDFQYFRVYRGTEPEFVPEPANMVHATAETDWLDPIPQGWKYHYKLSAVDDADNESDLTGPDVKTSVGGTALPKKTALYRNAPNPFNPTTTIRYDLSTKGTVTLRIYNAQGALVRTLVDRVEHSGRKSVEWDGRDAQGVRVASGVYFYRLEAPGYVKTLKMVLAK